ncbi:LytR C-terminal domain-containing protein, partial [Geodermatophilus sp. CPCC 205506]|uniref:LytR C-terminal domain-containing protein n=1 Tax=Geodermatophilus sp. CPCC 205506 TaxID=2936596 RepID=UPI003EEE273B
PAARPRPVEPAPETRVRLPLPPAAAAAPVAPPAPVAPRTTVAPFQAVPTPSHGSDEPRPEAGPRRGTGTEPAAEPSWRAGRPAAVEAPSRNGSGSRDWTSPSRVEPDRPAPAPVTTAIPDRNPARAEDSARRTPAPATEAIPDRNATTRDRGDADDRWADEDDRVDEDDDLDEPADLRRGPVTGPVTGPSTEVVGGRAALRAERQAAEAERRKSGRRSGATAVRLDDEDGPRRPSGVRRAATGLLAVAVVALVVLGVYSFAVPDAEEASRSQSTATTHSTSAATAPPSSVLPPLEVEPLPPAEGAAPAADVRAPVTVLNATGITGLAADVAGAIGGQGFESPGVGQYQGGDIAVTTVYYTEGDETQRQAAVRLVELFPEIHGPAVRFFEVPDVAVPGLVLVATGEWRP